MASELLTVKEAAALLRVKERTMLEYLRSGIISGVKMGTERGRRWRVPRESIDRFVQERLSEAHPTNKGEQVKLCK